MKEAIKLVGMLIGVIILLSVVVYGSVAVYQPFKVWVATFDVERLRNAQVRCNDFQVL